MMGFEHPAHYASANVPYGPVVLVNQVAIVGIGDAAQLVVGIVAVCQRIPAVWWPMARPVALLRLPSKS